MMTMVRLLPSRTEAGIEVPREVDSFLFRVSKVAAAECGLRGGVAVALMTSRLLVAFGVVTSLLGVDVSVGHRSRGGH
ncbi:unnamed protein product [Echinostoma caproni]|uniref:Uncharacterized protein n=1 Tax=Echinostoma caproni TaxID=27848 RepID=A0A183AWH7_9TREM|nr:unnamed protein product [Echinostoma caproni]